jgi:hypothetical protein
MAKACELLSTDMKKLFQLLACAKQGLKREEDCYFPFYTKLGLDNYDHFLLFIELLGF